MYYCISEPGVRGVFAHGGSDTNSCFLGTRARSKQNSKKLRNGTYELSSPITMILLMHLTADNSASLTLFPAQILFFPNSLVSEKSFIGANNGVEAVAHTKAIELLYILHSSMLF